MGLKLIVEDIFQNTSVSRDEETKNLYIEGIYLQSEVLNNNKRKYKKSVLEREVSKFQKSINENRAFGELSHPCSSVINPDRISHRIVSLNEDGNNFIGKSIITNTPCGNIARGIIESGGVIGVSSRGLGTLKELHDGTYLVNDDYDLSTIDIVINPSAPDAFVNGIMESKEWIWESGILKEVDIEHAKKEIEHAPAKRLQEVKIYQVKRLLDLLNSNI